jgi:hypothetical protein
MDAVDKGQARAGGARPGIVAAVVLRAACSSARMSEAFIARTSGVSTDTIRSWADGSWALASVPFPQLERLEEALLTAGAEPALVADLCAACWCDLALAAIAAGEDATVLLADPIARTDVFWELLAWAAAGQVPARYSHHVPNGRLVADHAAAERAIEVLNLTPSHPKRAGGQCSTGPRRQRPEHFPRCHRRS